GARPLISSFPYTTLFRSAVVEADQETIVAGQENAVRQFIGQCDGIVMGARISGQPGAAGAIEDKQLPVRVHRIDELRVRCQKTQDRKTTRLNSSHRPNSN